MRRRQADFFLRFAECVEPKINSKDRGILLEWLELEHDNLRAALARSRDEEAEGEMGLRLAGALAWFWFHRGYWSEGLRWLRVTLARRRRERLRGRRHYTVWGIWVGPRETMPRPAPDWRRAWRSGGSWGIGKALPIRCSI